MKKYSKYISIIAIVVVFGITVGYAALGSEMSISGIVGEVRLKKDIRVTDFSYSSSTSSASTSNVDYSNKALLTDIVLPNSDSTVTYKVEVTNFGNVEMGIYELIGLPENLTYEVTDYTLKEKICDTSNVCASGIVKTFYVTIKYASDGYSSTNTVYSLDMKVDFRQFYTISYDSSITNNGYPSEIIGGGNLGITFTDPVPDSVKVYSDGLEVDSSLYTYVNGILTYNNISGNIVLKSNKTLYKIMQMATNGPDTNIDFSQASSATNGDGVNTVSDTENDEYPIYYFRGNVENNNVMFAGHCWKMVRTTELGGVKLVYNGAPLLNQSEYNVINNNTYTFNSSSLIWTNGTNSSDESKDISFSVEKKGDYILYYSIGSSEIHIYLDDIEIFSDSNNDSYSPKTEMLTFAGLTTSNVIKIQYIMKSSSSTLKFSIGKLSGDATVRCGLGGTTSQIGWSIFNDTSTRDNLARYINADGSDSTIKGIIDEWYEQNIIEYTSVLEDTPWCNDREEGTYNMTTFFKVWNRLITNPYTPSLECNSEYQLTVASEEIDKHLKYPIALLTADEVAFSDMRLGNGMIILPETTSYLKTDVYWLTLSPGSIYEPSTSLSMINAGNYLGGDSTTSIRPSIVLKNGISVVDGDGTSTEPYILDVPNMISFDVDGELFVAEEGMTWGQWIESSYNTQGYMISDLGDNEIVAPNGLSVDSNSMGGNLIHISDVITNGTSYYTVA